MEIPPIEWFAPEPLNADQERFLEHWKLRWEQGDALQVGTNVGYPVKFISRHIKGPSDVIAQIPSLLSAYRGIHESFDWLFRRWISDYNLFVGHY